MVLESVIHMTLWPSLNVDAYLAQYGFRDASFKATAATLFGENNPTGLLPVTIPGQNGGVLYEYGHGLSY